MRFLLRLGLAACLSSTALQAWSNTEFLAPDQAFQLSVESLSTTSAQLSWKIAPHYYLYHDQFKLQINQKPVALSLPKGKMIDDPTFGRTEVHYQQVNAQFKVEANSQYLVMWQGCSSDGLCYPVQRRTIQTDAQGLFPQGQQAQKTRGLSVLGGNTSTAQTTANSMSTSDTAAQNNSPNNSNAEALKTQNNSSAQPAAPKQTLNNTTSQDPDLNHQTAIAAKPNPALTENNAVTAQTTQQILDSNTTATSASQAIYELEAHAQSEQSALTERSLGSGSTDANADNSPSNASSGLQINNDQGFFQLLSPERLGLNLLIFFMLGVLLAFLPCSLPLIPILSGIIVQGARGYKAVAIALCFVVSMALVYALMGVVVAEIGYSFQRWFQSPILIGIFAAIFVALALNLFGLYQLSMPQALIQRLDGVQNKQKGGTFIGAIVMGILSALIVGPCMSAPLAGALLFVSQSQDALLGGIYLFVLGLGIGLPLFIASVFGAKYLPKPGVWMDRIKVGFGFVMLMVAVYFVRPMIPSLLYYVLLAILALVLAGYLIKIRRSAAQKSVQIVLILCAALSLSFSVWQMQHALQSYQAKQSSADLAVWTRVDNEEALNQALALAQQQQKPILIDVYADWCIACQPIEREVIPRTDVQAALATYSLIKLDLSNYNPSQDLILKQRQILGPPTMLFLSPQGEEQRQLRLTGTFTAKQLLKQIALQQDLALSNKAAALAQPNKENP